MIELHLSLLSERYLRPSGPSRLRSSKAAHPGASCAFRPRILAGSFCSSFFLPQGSGRSMQIEVQPRGVLLQQSLQTSRLLFVLVWILSGWLLYLGFWGYVRVCNSLNPPGEITEPAQMMTMPSP